MSVFSTVTSSATFPLFALFWQKVAIDKSMERDKARILFMIYELFMPLQNYKKIYIIAYNRMCFFVYNVFHDRKR